MARVRYDGPYETVEVNAPGVPQFVDIGAEYDVDDETAAGLCEGPWTRADGSAWTVTPEAPQEA